GRPRRPGQAHHPRVRPRARSRTRPPDQLTGTAGAAPLPSARQPLRRPPRGRVRCQSQHLLSTPSGGHVGHVIRYQRQSGPGRSRYCQPVELRQLEAFVAVATELHFGRAAERLHLSAPTLSELIRRLERELGTPLFTRTPRRVALTSAGAELLTRTKVILDEVAAARAAVRRVAGGEAGGGRIRPTPPGAPGLRAHPRGAAP